MGTVTNSCPIVEYDLGKNMKVVPPSDQLKELQTILRDRFVLQYAYRI